MSTVAIDLFIQDFVLTNKILNQHLDWSALVSRRFQEAGPAVKVLSFKSGEQEHLAVAQIIGLPDGDCLRIEMTRPAASVGAEEHRMDCLRMMHQATHSTLNVDTLEDKVIVRLSTRHRGLINVAFVLYDAPLTTNPYLV